MIQLLKGDCLELMKDIPDESIDLILCDLPYGTTARNEWDVIIPFKPMWSAYERIIKPNGTICLFSQQPFTAKLISSNYKLFRYEWIWHKSNATGFLNANRMPLKAHENICVFYKKLPTYNPQKWKSKPYKVKRHGEVPTAYNKCERIATENTTGERYPIDIIKFSNAKKEGLHPTQKPVDLLEYLVCTYTDVGGVVLDNCMGSGSTGVACVRTGRNFIGIELDEKYFEIAKERIEHERG